MCNAWNHQPGCTCGWGGEGHLGKSDVGWNSASGKTSPSLAKPNEFPEYTGSPVDGKRYVTPNARCPVCGKSVYFFQSENGGRVFFDDLGSPWPKHPCTDNPIPRKDTILAPFAPSALSTFSRLEAGASKWRALLHVIVGHAHGILSLKGLAHNLGGEHSFYFIGSCRLDGQYQFEKTAFIEATPPQDGVWNIALLHRDSKENLNFKSIKMYVGAQGKEDVETWERALQGSPLDENAVGWTLSFRPKKNPVLENSNLPSRIARYWFARCAQGGEWVGHYNLGMMLFGGLGGERDEAGAFLQLMEVVRSSEAVSLRKYAECYRNGIGCVKNEEIANALEMNVVVPAGYKKYKEGEHKER